MKLADVIKSLDVKEIIGDKEISITSISQDSRDKNLTTGSLYCAVVGSKQNGHDYIDDALSKGVSAIVCQDIPTAIKQNVCYVVIENVQKVVSTLASNFYNNPSLELKVIGVTGTNGKTSIARSLFDHLCSFGEKASLLSTIDNRINDSVFESELTTGDPISVQKFMRQARDQGCDYLFMEVSSHALHQHRVAAVDFDVAVFTNLSVDHLDYHKSIDAYAECKKALFDMLKEDALAIYNQDDDYGSFMIKDTLAVKKSYGMSTPADYNISDILHAGIEFKINNELIKTMQISDHSVYNNTAIYACLIELGFGVREIIKKMSDYSGVKGRLENIINNKGITAIVDYAHTPDALENVLKTLHKISHNNILTIFGCGGDRDRTKRPTMALIAEKYSDAVVVTNDNPRTENTKQIFNDIESGFTKSNAYHAVIPDREVAIARTVKVAEPGDILLVAGKGHEDYQIIGTEKIYFDDRVILEKYLSK